jgi:Fe2+ transport system protein FeoA
MLALVNFFTYIDRDGYHRNWGNMTLDELDIGKKSKIIAVRGQGALRDRLLDMGLTPKTEVMVRKVAPMGDPIELMLRGYELTLRKSDAKNIEIEKVSNDICTGGESKLRENNAVQSVDGLQPARGQFSWRHRRKQRRGHSRS